MAVNLLSRQLDRIPFPPDGLTTESMPRMHLVADIDDPDAPEEFTARFLQACLVDFWSFTLRTGASYDVIMAEETYERFCNESMYGYEPWRLQKLRALKAQYDPDNRFAYYNPIVSRT